ncbi:MAG: helix-turn-helix domain-containing protein [Oscillospiraceae bacterium]|nr:helix-turn-helix domain-containing protein [Oscillospiraceae bacterium]
MKLSLWIIADKLKAWSPEVSILSGKAEIAGARPMTAPEKLRDDMVYIASGTETGTVCIHKDDRIFLKSRDSGEVLSAVLDIFDSFNQWQEELSRAASDNKSIQELIDLSSYAIPFPVIVADSFGNVVGCSSGYGPGEVDEYWDNVLSKREVPSVSYNESRLLRLKNDWSPEPMVYRAGKHGVIGMHIAPGGEIVGSVIIVEFGGSFGPGTKQLAAVFRDAVAEHLAARGDNAELRTVMAIASDFLDGKTDVDYARLWELTERLTCRGEEDLELVLIKNLNRSDFNYKSSAAYHLSETVDFCFGFVFHDYVAAVIRAECENDFLEKLALSMGKYSYVCGVSLPFSDPESMQKAGNQAALAIISGDMSPGSVSRCVDKAYIYLLNKLAGDRTFIRSLLHPALAKLKKYDEKRGTDYYETLYRYLILERNVVSTAAALFIHRNSMIYRLKKIEQLINVNLDDPVVRVYIMLSYHIEKTAENRPIATLFEENGDTVI